MATSSGGRTKKSPDDDWGQEQESDYSSDDEKPVQLEGVEPAMGPKLRNPITFALFRACMQQDIKTLHKLLEPGWQVSARDGSIVASAAPGWQAIGVGSVGPQQTHRSGFGLSTQRSYGLSTQR